jgi:hypothetical protein
MVIVFTASYLILAFSYCFLGHEDRRPIVHFTMRDRWSGRAYADSEVELPLRPEIDIDAGEERR